MLKDSKPGPPADPKKSKRLKYLLRISLSVNLLGILLGIWGIYQLGGWNYFKFRLTQRGVSAAYEHRKSLYTQMRPDTASIVFLGNSITAQCDWFELLRHPGIKNRGIPGDRIKGVRDRLLALQRLDPRQIFLMIGINDLLFNSPEVVIRQYYLLIDELQREFPSCELHLNSILPVNNEVRNTFIKNEDVRTVNEAVRRLAGERNLNFIDLTPLMSDASGRLKAEYTLDGVHLNGEAYQVWGNAIKDLLLH